MVDILRHAHSGIRWIVLILLLFAIVNAFLKWQSGKSFADSDRKLFFFSMLSLHIQFLIGLALYFTSHKVVFAAESMKNAVNRFYLVEHSAMMLIAIALVTIGFGKVKKVEVDTEKFKKGFIFYFLGLVLILAGIPWPFRNLGGQWF